ncbi:MAG: DUF3137 domain-containing protein [Pseudomonadota bacterium]|nr:DUF3137 domain-containing protein [Pseudomonadota bacterium]
MLFGSVATGISVGLGIVALLLQGIVPEESIFSQPFYVALVLALAALAAIASWITLLRPEGNLAARVWEAVEAHFAALFSRDENDAFAAVILQDLADDDILDSADYAVASHHAGSYRGCRIRLFGACPRQMPDARRNVAGSDLVVARISLPMQMAGSIGIDTDRSRLPEGQPFHVDHDQFDPIFGVTCTDKMVAKSLLTSQMAESLLLVQQRIANPLNKTAMNGVRVAVQIADGSLVLLVEQRAGKPGRTHYSAAALESMARSLVMRFATVPGLVDELYGDSETPPAFAPLPAPDRDGSQISL